MAMLSVLEPSCFLPCSMLSGRGASRDHGTVHTAAQIKLTVGDPHVDRNLLSLTRRTALMQ